MNASRIAANEQLASTVVGREVLSIILGLLASRCDNYNKLIDDDWWTIFRRLAISEHVDYRELVAVTVASEMDSARQR